MKRCDEKERERGGKREDSALFEARMCVSRKKSHLMKSMDESPHHTHLINVRYRPVMLSCIQKRIQSTNVNDDVNAD